MTFLLAQYRAIFKRAYFKGLAAAVLMTAGLAAGAAQAAELSSGFKAGDAIITGTANDSFKTSDPKTASKIEVGTGHKLTTSGAITVSDGMTLNGELTIESGSILLAKTETVNGTKNQTVYRSSLKGTGAKLDLTGNIGAASFELSNGELVLNSGGDGNTNLTAYGEGWNQTTTGKTNSADYDRDTANGTLTNMKVKVNSGTNVAALNHLRITGGSEVTLSGAGTSGSALLRENTSYLEGSRQLTI